MGKDRKGFDILERASGIVEPLMKDSLSSGSPCSECEHCKIRPFFDQDGQIVRRTVCSVGFSMSKARKKLHKPYSCDEFKFDLEEDAPGALLL